MQDKLHPGLILQLNFVRMNVEFIFLFCGCACSIVPILMTKKHLNICTYIIKLYPWICLWSVCWYNLDLHTLLLHIMLISVCSVQCKFLPTHKLVIRPSKQTTLTTKQTTDLATYFTCCSGSKVIPIDFVNTCTHFTKVEEIFIL